MVLFDATILLLLLDPTLPAPTDAATGKEVTDVGRRINHLVSSLQKDRTKIIIPTPALAEVLTQAERAGADYFTKLHRSAAFRFEPFETRAAIELARMTALAIAGGDKREGLSASWNKVKFDRQIVAIAKVTRVSTVYSDDENLGKLAKAQGLGVTTIGELPLPSEDAQMAFAWDVMHDEQEADDD